MDKQRRECAKHMDFLDNRRRNKRRRKGRGRRKKRRSIGRRSSSILE